MQKILILRPDNIGDVVLFSGCLRHYRNLFNKAKISLIVKEKTKELVDNCPYVDEIMLYDKFIEFSLNRQFRFLSSMQKLFLKKAKWDVIICPVRSVTEEMLYFIKHSNPEKAIGIVGCNANLKNSRCRPEDIFTDFMHFPEEKLWQHELETNRQFLEFVANKKFSILDILPEFWTSEEDRLFAEKAVTGGNVVGLVMCGSLKRTEYPFGNYSEIFEELSCVKQIVLFNSGVKRKTLKSIENSMVILRRKRPDISIINLINITTVSQFIECVRRCNLLLSVETGPLHIATALGIPTVGIMGGGHWKRFYPWGNKAINRVANKTMECYHCNFNCIFDDFRCIKEIPISLIKEQCRIALSSAGKYI